MAATLTLKFLKNYMIGDLGLDRLLMPAHRTVLRDDPNGLYPRFPVSSFDLEAPHVVTLPDIEPRIPAKRPEWSNRYYDSILDAAYADATRRRLEAANVAKKIQHFVNTGVLAIVDDPSGFLVGFESFAPSDAEIAVATEVESSRAAKAKKAQS